MSKRSTPRDDAHVDSRVGTGAAAARASMSAALAVTGAATLTVQVLLLRELMTAWRGNEMSFGIVMTVWLLMGGLGSTAYGFAARRLTATRAALARGLVGLGLLGPAALFAARALRGAMGFASGEVSGFASLLLASLISLGPFTVVAGFLFALSTSVLHGESRSPLAAGRVYLLEAAGAATAGLIVSLVLLPRLDPVSISLTVTLLTGTAAVWLVLAAPRPRPSRVRGTLVAGVLVVAAAAATIGPMAGRLDDASVGAQWRDVGFVSQTNSVYGRVVASSMGSQKSLYESGVLAASHPDRRTAEETVHLPMLAHPDPSRVLLLGGGLGGAVVEVLKHPGVTELDYVELDPELIRTAERAFDGAMTDGLNDPRVDVHYADARFFVKQVTVPYDVVIVAVPDPTTAQLNRFYTVEFLQEVDRALADDGVVGLSVQSADNYIGAELAAYLACLKATAESVFTAVATYAGDPCHILASRSRAHLTRDAEELSGRVEARGLDVVYVRDYYLSDRLSPERTAHLDAALEGVAARANTDLSPTAFYLSMVLWNRQFAGAPGVLLAAPRLLTDRNALIAALALAVVLSIASRRRGGARRATRLRIVMAAVVVVGATEISLELTALMAFQSIYGYVYHQLAIIVAAFMAGLALGGWLGTKVAAGKAGLPAFAGLQLLIAAVPLALGGVLVRIAALPAGELSSLAALFPLIVVGSALLAGVQFPLAVKLSARPGPDAGIVGGRLYGADLLGAAVGATLTAVFLLPVMGALGTMRALALLNAAVFVSLLISMAPGRLPRRP